MSAMKNCHRQVSVTDRLHVISEIFIAQCFGAINSSIMRSCHTLCKEPAEYFRALRFRVVKEEFTKFINRSWPVLHQFCDNLVAKCSILSMWIALSFGKRRCCCTHEHYM